MKGVLDRFGRLRVVAAGFALLPLVGLPVLGIIWLVRSSAGLWWLAAGLVALAFAVFFHWLAGRREAAALAEVRTRPGGNWPRQAQECWVKVQRMADDATLEAWPLDEPTGLGRLAEEVLRLVAGHLHPRSTQPLAEMTVPDTLMVIERAARELRLQITERIPGSHRITLAQVGGMRRLKGHYDRLSPLLKVVQAYVMPAALLRQLLGDMLLGSVFQAGSKNVQLWLLQEYIRKIGFHAIELYGGLVVLEDARPLESVTRGAREDLERAGAGEDARLEPLRIVMLGRVNAGKSSLVNALFGELVAATDVIPDSTAGIVPYRLERDDEVRALVYDTPGFDSDTTGQRTLEKASLGADLVIWVTAADRPDRAEERARLDRLRHGLADPARRASPVLVALTHIDRLRPLREWDPPYDLDPPEGPKAEQIADAVIAAADDLGVDVSTVIPVCTAPERVYNVDDVLWAAMLFEFPEANRVRLLRCQRARRSEQEWGQLRRQLRNSGRFLVSLARARRGT
ncbi:MAG TPA: GTPase [Gammaproteobacteria bacterium]|nr:GTPase [Gammaproteobacteria bacterium]